MRDGSGPRSRAAEPRARCGLLPQFIADQIAGSEGLDRCKALQGMRQEIRRLKAPPNAAELARREAVAGRRAEREAQKEAAEAEKAQRRAGRELGGGGKRHAR